MIRLLKIKPAIFRADPVDCELTHHRLEDAPSYGALSYCWGTGPESCKILCNGRVFLAGQNLEDALKRLRAGFGPGQREEYIWADAICINQQDLAEKSEQIALMQHIYLHAQTVYVDLGNIEGDLGPAADLPGGDFTIRFTTGAGMGSSTVMRPYSADHPLNYKTVLFSLTKPWFTRTWIIQEITLAKKARFMFQGNIFDKTQFDEHLSAAAMVVHHDRQEEIMLNPLAARGFINYHNMREIKRLWLAGSPDSLALLRLTRDFEVTEPKDKIFGLMALMTDSDREAVGPYSQSLRSIYQRFAALHIRRGRGLTVLDRAGIQRRLALARESPPSWVPDCTAQTVSAGGKAISSLRPVPYAAGTPHPSHIRLLLGDDDDIGTAGLSVRGIPFDTLASVHDVVQDDTAPDFTLIQGRISAAAGLAALAGPTKTVYADVPDAFARLLLMGDTHEGANAIHISSPITHPAATCLEAARSWRAGKRAMPPRPGRRLDPVETFKMQVCAACVGRRFAITRKGYFAMVPRLAREGDVVGVFYGAAVPYVLRKKEGEGRYVLVGDCYVQGLMEGEVPRILGSELQDLILV